MVRPAGKAAYCTPVTPSEQVQAFTALSTVVVACVAAYIAWKARGVAHDANAIARRASHTAEDALVATRRQTALAAIPYLTVGVPEVRSSGDFMLVIRNGGPTVAYGILVTVAAARSRSVDDIDRSSSRSSGRAAALAPGDDPLRRSVSGSTLVKMNPPSPLSAWTAFELEYNSPLGASVSHTYLWDGARRWRLHRVRVDPGEDAGSRVQFDIALGPSDEEPELPVPMISWGSPR